MVIRGLRAVADFEYEFQMASINKRLHGELETVFLMAAEQQHFVASRFVKKLRVLAVMYPALCQKMLPKNWRQNWLEEYL